MAAIAVLFGAGLWSLVLATTTFLSAIFATFLLAAEHPFDLRYKVLAHRMKVMSYEL